MNIKQISIFVENKPGRLATITKKLGDNNIDIRALSIADTKDFGILRLIVSDPNKTEVLLKDAGYTVAITNVIAVAISDTPGSLASIIETLSSNEINVEYMYAFITREKDNAYVILRVEDNDKAIKVLNDNNVKMVTTKDIYEV